MKQNLLLFIYVRKSVALWVFSNYKLQLIVLEKCFDKSLNWKLVLFSLFCGCKLICDNNATMLVAVLDEICLESIILRLNIWRCD